MIVVKHEEKAFHLSSEMLLIHGLKTRKSKCEWLLCREYFDEEESLIQDIAYKCDAEFDEYFIRLSAEWLAKELGLL